MNSFHDHWLTGHTVDGEKGLLIFRLSEDPRSTEKPRLVDLVFEGLQDYFLEHDLGVNVVYSIQEKALDSFLAENQERFKEQSKWGWPKFWKGDVEKTHAFLSKNQSRSWGLETSYGLSGWVVATRVQERARIA
jgi:hypothetical protein